MRTMLVLPDCAGAGCEGMGSCVGLGVGWDIFASLRFADACDAIQSTLSLAFRELYVSLLIFVFLVSRFLFLFFFFFFRHRVW